jgi:hypothetical protein
MVELLTFTLMQRTLSDVGGKPSYFLSALVVKPTIKPEEI